MGYGLGMALKGYMQGEEDRRRHDREDANQQWLQEDRAYQREQRDYQKSLRPLKERALNAQVGNAETNLEKNQFGLDVARKKLPYEMDNLEANRDINQIALDMKKAEYELYKQFQNARSDNERMALTNKKGEEENKFYGIIYRRAKMGDGPGAARLLNEMTGNGVNNAADVVMKNGKLIAVDANGQPVVSPDTGQPLIFDLSQLEALYGNKAEKGRFTQSDGVVLDTATGKTSKAAGGNIGGKSMFGKVQLNNGKVVTESDVRNMYLSEWGRPDPSNPMNTIMREGAPSYLAFRNSLVTKDYAINSPQAYAQEYDMTPEEKAQQEASNNLGLLDYIPFVNPDEQKVAQRADEIRQERARRTARGVPEVNTGVNWESPRFQNMQWKAKNGTIITMGKILATAKNRNMTPEQVMEKIGLDPKSVAAKAQ